MKNHGMMLLLSLKILFFYFIMGSYLSHKETFLAEETN